ncbi:MAG: hypothetical protein ABWZ58_00495 [Acidimicrobiia bacterium]
MSRPSIQGLTGLVVFIAGILALHATTTGPGSSESVDTPVGSEAATIQGMDLSVLRALESEGRARVLTAEEQATIPATVARTLIEHGAALTLPSGGDR